MDGFMWEMKQMADQGDQKGKGKAQLETEKEKSDSGVMHQTCLVQ